MGLLLFRAFLAINAFNIATENPVTPNPYRFPVYPVNECPKSENEFKTAAQRRNCTRGSRYLCAPNKYISSLIEFCTDRSRGLYKEGSCVLLEGTGDLDSYSCEEKFNSSCPLEPYFDEDIFKYPACLEIDRELQCFVADNNCSKRELPTIETPLNISTMETVGNETFRRSSPRLLAIVYIIAVVSAGMILILVIFQKRRKEQGERYKKKDENKSLLKDPEPPIEQNDDVQLDQTVINVSKHNQIQKSTDMLPDTVKNDTQKSKPIQREEKQNEESGYKTATVDGKQHKPEIDDDKLRQFLSKGNISVCHVRCIIVGCGKAGKTTLLKRLQNASFDELMRIERTEMVDFHVNSFEVLLEEETIQSVNKEDTLPTILFSKEKLEMGLKANAGKMTEEADQPGVNKEDTLPTTLFSKEKLEMGLKANAGKMTEEADQPGVGGKNLLVENSSQKNTENIPRDVPKNPANNNNAENEGKSIPEPQDKIQIQLSPNTYETHVEDDKINFEKYAILKIKDAVNELLNENDLRPRITFLDFAGQSMYYAFHQIFLRPKSCSILVVDMTKSLIDEVDVQDGNEKECSQFALWRYRDYYKFWLKSIDSFSDTDSPVIIVGTHADKLSKEECRTFRGSLLKFFDNLSHSNLRRHINADRMYTIGFPDSGSELEDLKDLKKCIAYIMKCPRYSEENIRPVWALFEHLLNRLKETEKVIPKKILSDYCDQLSAQEFRLDQSEISKMLVFFHRVGVLLYFDQDGLKEKIILDIQWLLDAFKCIIEYPVRPEENDIKRRHFCRTGELDNAELDRIWHIQGKDFLKHKTTIIAYMQQLGLLMPLKELNSIDSTVYYFPSMNSKKFDKTGENNSKSSIICFKFDDEMQLPINVFHRIVLKCSKLNNWSILTEGTKNNICLYQNAACFSFQKHVVVLCNCNFEIRVQVWASPKIYDGILLKKIKHSVEDIIRGDDLSYKIGYKCRKDVLNVEEDVSFISQSTFPVSNYLCEICDVDKKHVVDNDICWELEVNENKDKANKQNLGEVSGNTSVGDQKKDTERSQSPIDIREKHRKGSLSEHKMSTLSSVADLDLTETDESSMMDWESSQSKKDELEPKYYAPKKRLQPKSGPTYQAKVAIPPKTIFGRSDVSSREEFWSVVVALDFGTTYSGYAFWKKDTDPLDITSGKWKTGSKNVLESLKTPTSLLLNKENEVIEFGFEAEQIFKELVKDGNDKEYRFFRQFKMHFYHKKSFNMDMEVKDHLNNPMKALDVFSLSIRYLKDECIELFQKKRMTIHYDEIQWILTVPAIWDESAKQFMRKAAEQAEIPSDQLKLALEPEAAAIYVVKGAKTVFGKESVTTVKPGTKIMVADLGGETADMTVLELNEDKTMKQLHRSFGGSWGGNLINQKIWEIMYSIFGEEIIEEFKKQTADYMDMESNIELKKRDITVGSKLQLTILPSLADLCKTVKGKSYKELITQSKEYADVVKVRTGKLSFEPKLVEEIFDLTKISNIYTSVGKALHNQNMKGIKDIILVGGFAQADFIVRQFKERFSGYNVIIPTDPVLAVLNGAVMFGQDIDIISSRITGHTYGFDCMRIFAEGDPKTRKRKYDDANYCVGVFEKMVAIGESVDAGKTVEKEVFASSKDMKSMVLKFYQSDQEDPKFVSDRGCECIGKLSVEMPDLSGGTKRSVMVSIKFGETEITVCGVDKTTGKKQETVLDLLGDAK